jgi:hypothetical protein
MPEKKEKAEVNYTPVAAMKTERCALCRHYMALYGTCRLVKGYIKPGAWCKLWERRK